MIDLIIVNYKSTDLLHTCLSSIYENLNGFNINLHVVDNGSGDHVHLVKSTFPEVILTVHNQNLGFARAVNGVIKKTSSPYIVLLNPDTILLDGFFESVIPFIQNHPEVGVVGPKIMDPDGCTQGSARCFPGLSSILFSRTSLLTRLFPKAPITCANILSKTSDGRTPLMVDWVSGACQIIRREAIESVGLFDERFFLYWEDADLCKRNLENNWKVVYYPKASVIHHVGGSSKHRTLRSTYELHKCAYLLYEKYADPRLFILNPLIFSGLYLRFMGVVALRFIKGIYQDINGSGKRSGFQRDCSHFVSE